MRHGKRTVDQARSGGACDALGFLGRGAKLNVLENCLVVHGNRDAYEQKQTQLINDRTIPRPFPGTLCIVSSLSLVNAQSYLVQAFDLQLDLLKLFSRAFVLLQKLNIPLLHRLQTLKKSKSSTTLGEEHSNLSRETRKHVVFQHYINRKASSTILHSPEPHYLRLCWWH